MRQKEGRKIKTGSPMDAVAPFIMPTRGGSSNSFTATIDISACEPFIRKLRAEGMPGLGMMHVFMASYVRVVSQLPGLNRFIRGQRVFARNGIEICLTIKKEMALNAPETVIKLYADPKDTIKDIYDSLAKELEENKQSGDHNNMDTAARILMKLPSMFLKFMVWFLKLLDYFGLLPRFLTKLSPFHGSMFITNMGSLGLPPVYHHLYNFGNLPIFVAIGAKRTEYVTTKTGEVEKHRLMDFTLMCDERICDGHYYATAFKMLKRICEHPEQLIHPPESIVQDIK